MSVRKALFAIAGLIGTTQMAAANAFPKSESWTLDGFAGLAKHGIYAPAWFIDPSFPPHDRDARPKTPLNESISYMLRVLVDETGKPKYCEVLLGKGPAEAGASFCSRVAEIARYDSNGKSFNYIFWVHAHQDPASGNLSIELGPKVEPDLRKPGVRR